MLITEPVAKLQTLSKATGQRRPGLDTYCPELSFAFGTARTSSCRKRQSLALEQSVDGAEVGRGLPLGVQ